VPRQTATGESLSHGASKDSCTGRFRSSIDGGDSVSIEASAFQEAFFLLSQKSRRGRWHVSSHASHSAM